MLAVWIRSNGDDTASKFSLRINRISLKLMVMTPVRGKKKFNQFILREAEEIHIAGAR